jgi:di/tricarboxylate transporter
MTIEIVIVLGVVILAITLFATEKLPVDLVAITVMAVLLISGIITPAEGISGFSNTATITVGAMFIISFALNKTGAVGYLGNLTVKLFKINFWLALAITMITVGITSGFINNTPVVAVFIPILLMAASENNLSASKLLMPISFASMFGGVCTLIGTSTNILVSSIAVQYGERPFGMFEFAPLGIIFFFVGMLYMMFIGVKLIPDRRGEGDLTKEFEMTDYITDIVLLPEAKSVGKKLAESPLVKELDIDIIEVIRDDHRLYLPPSRTILRANDVLRVRCDVKKIQKLKERVGIELKPHTKWEDLDFHSEDAMLVEAVIAPNSELEGKTLKSSNFRNKFLATALAIRHRGQLMQAGFADIPLKAGDALLIEIRTDQFERLKVDKNFVLISELGIPKFRKNKMLIAISIVAGVIVTAAMNILPILVSAIIGATLLIMTRCITLEEAYKAIEWKVIFLLGGILSLGIALEKTGTALLVSNLLISFLGALGPVAIVSAFYLLTSLLTETMSNNATAVLLAPIAIATAVSMNVDPRPFLMAVTFAASASFMTPVGYQTNTMIFGVGQYKFKDFLIVGTPLNIIFWILATIFIPIIFPF